MKSNVLSKQSHFRRSYNPNCYAYIENGSKNKSGASLKQPNKVVPMNAINDSRPRCLDHLLYKYLSKIPPRGKELDTFHLQPTSKIPANPTGFWNKCSPVCSDNLRKFLRDMCEATGIKEKKTNHRLRVSCATALFSANLPEKLILLDMSPMLCICMSDKLSHRYKK